MLLNRRDLLSAAAAAAVLAPLPALAAEGSAAATPAPAVPTPRFDDETVIARARELAAQPFDAESRVLPAPFAGMSYDEWRQIRFRPDKAIFPAGGPFRMQLFHPGFLYKRPVVVNVVRQGAVVPVPYATSLFEFGRAAPERAPADLGFAGFRLHATLNDPRVYDELISFLGASYFRFLGRGQRYGLSARGLAVNLGAAETEEFPIFREFWVDAPESGSDRAVIHALLDGPSVTGAYRFEVYPGVETVIEVTAQIFARKTIARLGIAPLTSMFFSGESEPRRMPRDFRPELHDSDGLLIHSGGGEWIWRPLVNPATASSSSFVETSVRGFGLMQRDRVFEHYEDLDNEYQSRPSYWVEPREGWGEGTVELHEIPTADETNDNIVAYWAPKAALEAGASLRFGYRVTALGGRAISPGGYVHNTFVTDPRALGSNETPPAGASRFLIDFVGGDVPFYLADPGQVQVAPSISNGQVLRSFLVPNPVAKGFRAIVDVQVPPGQRGDLRVYLKVGARALTETWLGPVRG
jgi:glucans biosynthesis protein